MKPARHNPVFCHCSLFAPLLYSFSSALKLIRHTFDVSLPPLTNYFMRDYCWNSNRIISTTTALGFSMHEFRVRARGIEPVRLGLSCASVCSANVRINIFL